MHAHIRTHALCVFGVDESKGVAVRQGQGEVVTLQYLRVGAALMFTDAGQEAGKEKTVRDQKHAEEPTETQQAQIKVLKMDETRVNKGVFQVRSPPGRSGSVEYCS